jgi:hypothetical protein
LVNPSFCADGLNLQENGLDDLNQTFYENFAWRAVSKFAPLKGAKAQLSRGDPRRIAGDPRENGPIGGHLAADRQSQRLDDPPGP